MMRLLVVATIVFMCSMLVIPLAFAGSDQDTQAQIEALQAQIKAMQEQNQKQIGALQTQIDILKQNLAQQATEKEGLLAKVSKMQGMPFISFAKPYRLRKEEALQEEGKLNISGEIAFQFKEPTSSGSSSSMGFRAYELPEIFLDSNLTENVSFFAEVPLAYEGGGTTLEDGWVDLHFANGLAATGNTGVKIGQFHTPFGWDNDDNEAYVYGGRTSVDNTLVRSQRLDGQRLRERQIGIQGNYALDLAKLLKLEAKDPVKLFTSVGVFNGNGQTGNSQEWDNDDYKDIVTRLEAHFLNTVIGGSYWDSPRTKNVTSDTNNVAHTRDINRYGAHFKYPADVPFPAEDISLAGKRWLVWGEWVWSEADNSQVASEADTKTRGGYLEFDYGITPKLVGYLRAETYDPDRATDNNDRNAYILGAKWDFWKVCQLTLDYERDNFEGTTNTDRVGAMFKAMF